MGKIKVATKVANGVEWVKQRLVSVCFSMRIFRLVKECCAITLTQAHTHQYLFKYAIVAHAKSDMTSYSHANNSAIVLSYPFVNNSLAISCWVFIWRNSLHYIRFGLTSSNDRPTCLLSKTSLQTVWLPLKHKFYKLGNILGFSAIQWHYF